MKLLKNKEYKALIDSKKQAEKEIGRKENCIQKKQQKITETIDKIKTTINN